MGKDTKYFSDKRMFAEKNDGRSQKTLRLAFSTPHKSAMSYNSFFAEGWTLLRLAAEENA